MKKGMKAPRPQERERFERRFTIRAPETLIQAVDAHACAKLQSTAEWARQALLEKLTAEGFEVPPFTSLMKHRQDEKVPA